MQCNVMEWNGPEWKLMYAGVCFCMHAYMQVCMYEHVRVCMYACMCVCVFACMRMQAAQTDCARL